MGVQYTICHWAINRTDLQNSLSTTLDIPLHNPRASLEAVPTNSGPIGKIDIFTEPFLLLVIPYSANVPADPNL